MDVFLHLSFYRLFFFFRYFGNLAFIFSPSVEAVKMCMLFAISTTQNTIIDDNYKLF